MVGEVHGSWGKDRRCGVRAWGKVKEAGEVQLGPRGESVSVCRWFGRVNLGRRGSDDDAKDMSLTAPRKRVEQGEHQRDSAVHARRVGPLFDLAGLDVLAPRFWAISPLSGAWGQHPYTATPLSITFCSSCKVPERHEYMLPGHPKECNFD